MRSTGTFRSTILLTKFTLGPREEIIDGKEVRSPERIVFRH